MARNDRTHFGVGDNMSSLGLKPKHLAKQEFGRRLYRLMIARGWNQSELARRAGLTRDSVSTYVTGRSYPTMLSLAGLAKALDTTPEELLPNVAESAIESDIPSLEIRENSGDPTKAWIRVNRLVSAATAAQIHALLIADNAPSNGD